MSLQPSNGEAQASWFHRGGASFVEPPKAEVRRTPLPRTRSRAPSPAGRPPRSGQACTETERGGIVSITVSSGPKEASTGEKEEKPPRVVDQTSAGVVSVARREGRDGTSARSPDNERGPRPEERVASGEGERRRAPTRRVGTGRLVRALVIIVLLLWVLSLLAQGGQAVEVPPVEGQTHVLPANERVTDGARTRDLRSHNPPTPVSERSCTLQKRLIASKSRVWQQPATTGKTPSVVYRWCT